MSHNKKAKAAADKAAASNLSSSFKEQRAQALEAAAAYLTAAQEKAGPLASQASEKIAPLASQASEKIAPWAKAAGEKLTPLTEQAKVWGAQAKELGGKALSEAQKNMGPTLENAKEVASEKFRQAYDSFQEDILPGLEEKASQVSEHPMTQEARQHREAAVAAIRGESLEPEKSEKKHGGFKKFLCWSSVVSAVGVGVYAARKFLTSSDDGWTAHEPTETYSWTPKAPTAFSKDDAASSKDGADSCCSEAKGSSCDCKDDASTSSKSKDDAPATAPDTVTEGNSATEMTAEGAPAQGHKSSHGTSKPVAKPEKPAADSKPAAKSVADTAPEPVATPVAEKPKASSAQDKSADSYVGDNPPEGFIIKGNERSKKYHVPGSGGYDRTIADVWFTTEEAARKAGFTRAQR